MGRYRVGLFKGVNGVYWTDNANTDIEFNFMYVKPEFVKWLDDDWVEYEIPVCRQPLWGF